MRSVRIGALALLGMLWAVASAQAQFPNCIPEVDNEPLMPNPDGSYPKDPAIPYAGGGNTMWSTNKLIIRLHFNGKAGQPFFAKGVNYEPTQIGGSADFPPFNDFFYENDVKTWNPLWVRDLDALRAIGVNSIRVYGTWKWEPGSTPLNTGAKSISAAPFWKKLNFAAGNDPVSENNKQFCINPQKTNIVFQHATHLPFLEKLWNDGDDPVYMWIGISLELRNLIGPDLDRYQLRQFTRYTTKWLAKKYGNHPAVIGFVVGNEVDTPGTTTTSEFWDYINDLHQVIKASAPDKLTMFTFHDTEDFNRKITSGKFAGKRGPEVYQPDVWGFNPYNNPAPEGNLFSRFRDAVVTNCTNVDGNPCVKPLLYGEFGVPGNTHKATDDLDKLYPLKWTAPNFVFDPTPPPAKCLGSGQLGPPPGSGSNGPKAEFTAGKTIAVEMPANNGARIYNMPQKLVKYFKDSGVREGENLKAALQADFLREFWKVTEAHRADNTARLGDLKFSSGGYLFEYRDEWWKGKSLGDESNPLPQGPMWFHSSSDKQKCDPANRCGMGHPEQCQTGAANAVFPGGWGDEQWFGITGAKIDPNRKPNGADSDPVVNSNTGRLNGGPDILTPRAAVVAVCEMYGGPGCK